MNRCDFLGVPTCRVYRLGSVPYTRAWALQRALVGAVQEGRAGDALLLLEHPHVYTVGRRGRREHLLLPCEELQRLGAELFEVDRGGDVTYHGPGQLVGYPVLYLRERGLEAVRYMRTLEEALIRTLADFGVEAGRAEGRPGVWVGGEKVAALGVRISRGVTSHGFALNVNTDLSYFRHIVPCGIADAGVTSLERLLSGPVALERVTDILVRRFGESFGLEMQRMAPGSVWELALEEESDARTPRAVGAP